VAATARIGLVDYGMGNRRSVEKALEHVGAEVVVSAAAEDLSACDALVLPGVGAYPAGMRNLHGLGLVDALHAEVERGKPLLGICLGMQLLFDSSDELEPTAGLGLIAGEVTRLRTDGPRLPHIGWNEVSFERDSILTGALPSRSRPFYHVHSHAAHPHEADDVIAWTEYGQRFATIVGRGAVYGVQFHPEKSSLDGLQLLRAFVLASVRGTPAGSNAAAGA
jgi:glutamine amidotransferase